MSISAGILHFQKAMRSPFAKELGSHLAVNLIGAGGFIAGLEIGTRVIPPVFRQLDRAAAFVGSKFKKTAPVKNTRKTKAKKKVKAIKPAVSNAAVPTRKQEAA